MKTVRFAIFLALIVLAAKYYRDHGADSAQGTKPETKHEETLRDIPDVAINTLSGQSAAGGKAAKVDPSAAEVIRRAQLVPASAIDPLSPDEPLGNWLKKTLAAPAVLTWSTNDCGKPAGTGNQESVPVCAAAESRLVDGLQLSIWIAVGSQKLNGTSPAPDFSAKPELKRIVLSTGDHPLDCQLRLIDVPELVKASSMSPQNVEDWCNGRLHLQ